MLRVDVPGRRRLELEHLLLDLNGTLSDRGALIEGVAERLWRLRESLQPRLLSSDTFGTLEARAGELGLPSTTVEDGEAKRRLVAELGSTRCTAVGNGANDAAMLGTVGLGIVVIGPEGAAGSALAAADLVCRSIVEALDLLLDPLALAATLRS